jgi:RNA polymerase sigma-70 factor (ECF subfamily)
MEEVYRSYARRLNIYAYYLLKDEAEAEDIVQEILIRFWEKADNRFADEKALKSYLFNSVRNACLNKLEKSSVLQHHLERLNDRLLEEEIVTFDERVIAEIRAEINRLPARTRHVIERVFYRGMKYREIADELSVSINTVKTLLQHGLKHLRERFAGEIDPPPGPGTGTPGKRSRDSRQIILQYLHVLLSTAWF